MTVSFDDFRIPEVFAVLSVLLWGNEMRGSWFLELNKYLIWTKISRYFEYGNSRIFYLLHLNV